jgi:hypothetical protein
MYMALASLLIEYYFFFVVNFNKEGTHTVSIRSQKTMIVLWSGDAPTIKNWSDILIRGLPDNANNR